LSWVELLDSTQNVQCDAEGRRRGSRVFRVWNYARTQIMADPTSILNDEGVGLPAYNSEWEGMRLDAYQTAANGSVYDVTALYSNDRRFVMPSPVDRMAPGYGAWSGSCTTEFIELPFAYQAKTLVQQGEGNPPAEVVGWKFDVQRTPVNIHRISWRTNISASDVPRLVDALRQQTNKLHRINSKWYHFEGGDYAETEPGKWEVHYHWREDPGTPPIQYSLFSTTRLPPPRGSLIPGAPDASWSRPPYHEVILVGAADGSASSPPVFELFVPFDYDDPEGWADLPGMTP